MQSQITRYEARKGIGVLCFRVMKIGRQGTGLRIPAAIRQFGLQYSGSAGPEKYADAPGTIFILGGGDSTGEPVLFQAQLGETVVAAIIGGQIGAHAAVIQRPDLGDIGFQIRIFKCAGNQTRATGAQRLQCRRQSKSQAVGNRCVADD